RGRRRPRFHLARLFRRFVGGEGGLRDGKRHYGRHKGDAQAGQVSPYRPLAAWHFRSRTESLLARPDHGRSVRREQAKTTDGTAVIDAVPGRCEARKVRRRGAVLNYSYFVTAQVPSPGGAPGGFGNRGCRRVRAGSATFAGPCGA